MVLDNMYGADMEVPCGVFKFWLCIAKRDMVEYTLQPIPPMSGFIARSLDSPIDENDVSCQRLATKIFVITTCCGTFPAAISFRIAAPARLEINAEGMKSEPNIYIACYHRWSRADSAQTLRQMDFHTASENCSSTPSADRSTVLLASRGRLTHFQASVVHPGHRWRLH